MHVDFHINDEMDIQLTDLPDVGNTVLTISQDGKDVSLYFDGETYKEFKKIIMSLDSKLEQLQSEETQSRFF